MTNQHPLLDAHKHSGDRNGVLYYYSNGQVKALTIGSAGQLLTVASGLPSWAAAPAAGAPTDATYLVTTAHADLSAEVAVGATPGGELGGTWASPTVDSTHSGSAHSSFQTLAQFTKKIKASDETVNNSNVLQNDNDILQAVAANEKWAFDIFLDVETSTVADFKCAFTVPTSAAGTVWIVFDADTAANLATTNTPGTGFSRTITDTFTFIANVFTMVRITGVLRNSSNAGTLQFQWAQNTAEVSNTIVHAGSYGIFTRLS